MRTLAFVQARMSSRRLPGKVLQPLAGRPALERVVERLGRASGLDEVVVLTSTDPSDDPVAELAEASTTCSIASTAPPSSCRRSG
jgi:spore coat polysaccharide biosynthesis protein SpsF